MAIANCSVCHGEINTESSPEGKCVRCTEAKATAPGKPPATSTQKAGTFGHPVASAEPHAALEHAKKEAAGDDEDSPFGEAVGKSEPPKKSHR